MGIDSCDYLRAPKHLEYEAANGKYVVINPLAPGWLVTNGNGMLVLQLCDGVRSVSEIVRCLSDNKNIKNTERLTVSVCSFLEQAIKANIFFTETILPQHKPYLLNSIYLNMTDQCNLSCRYCFATSRIENGERLSFSDYKRIIDEVLTISPKISVNFTGGEPLLSECTLPVAKYAKDNGLETYLLTNGTMINENNVIDILSRFDHVKISIDGSTSEIHDFNRGIGSYCKALQAIEILVENKVDVQIAMVVTHHNCNDVVAMSEKWGNRLRCQPLFPAGSAKGDNDMSLTGGQYYDALCTSAQMNPFCDIDVRIKAHKENRSIMKCSIGDGEFSVSSTGDVYPCQLLHVEEFFVGNVRQSSLRDIYNSKQMNDFKQHTVDNIEGCKTCTLKYICGGACQARHYFETGTINKSGNFCEYEKKGIINGILNSHELVEV